MDIRSWDISHLFLIQAIMVILVVLVTHRNEVKTFFLTTDKDIQTVMLLYQVPKTLTFAVKISFFVLFEGGYAHVTLHKPESQSNIKLLLCLCHQHCLGDSHTLIRFMNVFLRKYNLK